MSAAARAEVVEPVVPVAPVPVSLAPPLPAITPAPADVEAHAWEGFEGEDSGDLVTNAEKGWVYSWLRPADYPPLSVQIQHERQKLINRGWVPCSGPLYVGAPRPEFVPNRPELEIWRCSQGCYDNEWRIDMARSVLDRRFADRHYRWVEKGTKRPGLPANIVAAMYAYHGLMQIPGKPIPPTREQLIALVRRMPVHPGAESVTASW